VVEWFYFSLVMQDNTIEKCAICERNRRVRSRKEHFITEEQ